MPQQTPFEILSFRVTPNEAASVRLGAEEAGDTLSAHLRSLVFGLEFAQIVTDESVTTTPSTSPGVATLRIELVDGRG